MSETGWNVLITVVFVFLIPGLMAVYYLVKDLWNGKY